MSAQIIGTSPITESDRPIVWVSGHDEVSALVAGYTVRIQGGLSLRIIADCVPPAAVSTLLTELRVGHLEDYDRAVVLTDWRRRVLASDSARMPALGSFVSVLVEY